MYKYVCMSMYVWVYVGVHMYECMHEYMHGYICMSIYVWVYMYEYIFMSIYVWVCIYVWVHIYKWVCVWVYEILFVNMCLFMTICFCVHMYCCLYLNVYGIFRSLAYAIICALLMNMCRKEKLPWTMLRRRAFLIIW